MPGATEVLSRSRQTIGTRGRTVPAMPRRLLATTFLLALIAVPARADAPIAVSATPQTSTVERGGRLVLVVRVNDRTNELVAGEVIVRLRRDGAPTLRQVVTVLPDDRGRWAHRIGIRVPKQAPAGRYRVSANLTGTADEQLATYAGGFVRVR